MVDSYLQFKTPGANAVELKGETRDRAMKLATPVPPFEIKTWSFGATNPLVVGSATGGLATGKVNFESFEITKDIDKASPHLFHTCCAGGHYKELVLWQRKSGGSSTTASGTVFLKFNFKLVFIENLAWAHGDEAPTETIKFAYGALSVTYYPQKSDGSIDDTKKQNAVWDRVLNAKIFDAGFGSPTTPETEKNPA
jgi:type VI secretion system Hcp family effector